MINLYFLILGILTSFLFPPFFVLPLGLVIFPCINIALDYLSKKRSKTNFFLSGFSYGIGFAVIYFIWLINPFFVFEETRNYFFLAIVPIIFVSILFGISFFLYKYLNNLFIKTIFIPIIFVINEMIISHLGFKFPWMTFSLIISNTSVGLYLIKFFGTHFTSLLVLLFYILPSLLIHNNLSEKKSIFGFYFSIIFLFLTFILILINFNLKYDGYEKNISVEIFQINSPLNSFEVEKSKSIYNNIENLIINSDADIIIFSENNYPFLIKNINEISLNKLLKPNQTLIIGGTRIEKKNYFNTFLVFTNNSLNYFDKKILVPFGEYLPFRKYLSFMEPITGTTDFSKGVKERIVNLKDDLSILPVICYEIIFFWKLLNKKNIETDFIINITNDSWFGNYIGPYQHFYLTKLRAAEYNKPIIRASNNGISAIIDNNGKVLISTKLNRKDRIFYNLKFIKFSNFIDIHIYCNLLILLLFLYIFYLIFKKE